MATTTTTTSPVAEGVLVLTPQILPLTFTGAQQQQEISPLILPCSVLDGDDVDVDELVLPCAALSLGAGTGAGAGTVWSGYEAGYEADGSVVGGSLDGSEDDGDGDEDKGKGKAAPSSILDDLVYASPDEYENHDDDDEDDDTPPRQHYPRRPSTGQGHSTPLRRTSTISHPPRTTTVSLTKLTIHPSPPTCLSPHTPSETTALLLAATVIPSYTNTHSPHSPNTPRPGPSTRPGPGPRPGSSSSSSSTPTNKGKPPKPRKYKTNKARRMFANHHAHHHRRNIYGSPSSMSPMQRRPSLTRMPRYAPASDGEEGVYESFPDFDNRGLICRWLC